MQRIRLGLCPAELFDIDYGMILNIFINESPVQHEVKRSKFILSLRISYTHISGSMFAEIKLRNTKIANVQELRVFAIPLTATSNQGWLQSALKERRNNCFLFRTKLDPISIPIFNDVR